jgi:hypothetical protein
MTGGRESINHRAFCRSLQARDETDPVVLLQYISARDLYLNLVGDDITIACSIPWMSRLIFDRESVNHNADNTGVLVRRRVLKIADRHTITTSRGRDGKIFFRRPAPIRHYHYVSCKMQEKVTATHQEAQSQSRKRLTHFENATNPILTGTSKQRRQDRSPPRELATTHHLLLRHITPPALSGGTVDASWAWGLERPAASFQASL